MGGTDSSKISPVEYEQTLSTPEDSGSLALIAAAAAAAISAPVGSSTIPIAVANDKQRQICDSTTVARASGDPYLPKPFDGASFEPDHTALQFQPPYHQSDGYHEYYTLPNVNQSVVGMVVDENQRHFEYLSAPHSFGVTIQSSFINPPEVACATSSRNIFNPTPTQGVSNIEEMQETKKWWRRRPKKKRASAKKPKSPFERRPVKGPGSRGKRGRYMCRLCGQAKARHVCSALEPYDASASQEHTGAQTETTFADEKIALGSGIRVIVVRERKVNAVDLLDGKEDSCEGNGEVAAAGGGGRTDDEAIIPSAAV